MLYTFLKFLGWGLLLAAVGGCVGWALRSLKCRGEVARVRATTVDADEVERMRHRLANLEQVVEERNRLRMQVADMRHADSPGVVLAPGELALDPDPLDVAEPLVEPVEPLDAAEAVEAVELVDEVVADAVSEGGDSADGDAANGDATDGDAANGDVVGGDDDSGAVLIADQQVDDVEASSAAAGFAQVAQMGDVDSGVSGANDSDDSGAELDMAAAESVFGKKIRRDDLSVVEGIGPKISELCRGIGIETWRQLAQTDVATLQSMLDAAGSRFQVHKPGTWPTQAALLADGRWADFKQLTDELDGGR